MRRRPESRSVTIGLGAAVAFSAATALLLFIGAQAAGTPYSSPPKAVYSRTELDFGELPRGAVLTAEVVVRNAGGRRLVVQQPDSSACECETSPPLIVPRGETDRLTVTWDTGDSRGELRKVVHLESNDPVHPRVPLVLRARVPPAQVDRAISDQGRPVSVLRD